MSSGFAKKGAGSATTIVVSETSREEREHVIKVLEHERRIYKLETSINRQSPRTEAYENRSNQDIEPFDTEFAGGRDQRFDGRTSSPIRLESGKAGQANNGKRGRVLSEF